VSCAFSREALALHVGGDLSGAAAEIASSHVAACDDCRRFLEQLHARQSLLQSLRRERASPSECTGMRREVMSIINDRRDTSGWALRIERAIMLGFRQRSYALAAFALLGAVSVSALAQMRHAAPDTRPSANVLEGRDTLVLPEGYRDWILVRRPTSAQHSGVNHGAATATRTAGPSVFINPSGYREYAKTGKFPEGTVMVWEGSAVLLASVKDSTRFDGGWGFFDFTGVDRSTTFRAQALPESSGCRACHLRDGETDHVFTQFYPVLHSAHRASQPSAPRGSREQVHDNG
jgi:hypothetical protein